MSGLYVLRAVPKRRQAMLGRFSRRWSSPGLSVLALALLFWQPAHALEVGGDAYMRERERLHEDTDRSDTVLRIRDVAGFGEYDFGADWQARLEGASQRWTLDGVPSRPLFDADVTRLQPSVLYTGKPWRIRATLAVLAIQDRQGLYALDKADGSDALNLPGVDVGYALRNVTLEAGGWREMDFFAKSDLTYTAVVYESAYLGAEWRPAADHAFRGRLTETRRVVPDDLELKRLESEIQYRLNDPIGRGAGAVWAYVQLRGMHWDYQFSRDDVWYALLENQFRAVSGPVTHVVTHALTVTNAYTVYRSGPTPDSIVEVDKIGQDLRNLVDYVAFGRVSECGGYWRAGLRRDDSLGRRAYAEHRISAGISWVDGN